MLWPKVDRPDRIPAMASSQMPPVESVRAPGFEPAFQKPSPKPAATVLTEVEPSRSAAATSSAPPETLLKCASARPSSPRSVVTAPGRSASSGGVASPCAASS